MISQKSIQFIIKLDIKMFHHESWKPTYYGVKMLKIKVINEAQKTLPAWDTVLL